MKAIRLTLLLLAGVCIAAPGTASADEIAVQGSTAAGGGLTSIVGNLNGEVRFSVTGTFSAVAGVRSNLGAVLFTSTVKQLWENPPYPLTRVAREKLADGRSRVILSIKTTGAGSAIFNGGSVFLSVGGRVIDEDRITLR
ncbi:MAG: hypothetical protein RLZZ179_3395 [Verrucomicrobiota bacterium]|jgi:hypothetical protein